MLVSAQSLTKKGVRNMCDGKKGCQKPEECSPEQVRECQCDTKKHPCETKDRNVPAK